MFADQGGEQRWCLGLPEVGVRGLTPEERTRIETWFAAPRAWVRAYGVFIAATLLLWPVAAGVFVVQEMNREGEIPIVLLLLAAFAVYLGIAGIVAGVAEIVIGESKGARWTLIALSVMVVGSGWTDDEGFSSFVLSAAIVVFTLVGLVYYFLRVFRLRDTFRKLREIDLGLRANTVAEFAGDWVDYERDTAGVPAGENARVPGKLSVLVPAGVVLRYDDAPTAAVWLVDTPVLANRGAAPPIAPVLPMDVSWLDVEPGNRQRQLMRTEIAELKRLARRTVAFGVGQAGGVGWLIGLVVINADRISRGVSGPARWEAYAITAVIPTLMVLHTVYRAWQLVRDASTGVTVLVDRATENGRPITTEILPVSKRVWTTDGTPAPWRPQTLLAKEPD